MNRTGFGGDPSFNFSTTGSQRNGGSPPNLTEEDLDYLKTELTKVEDEIQTLRQVLLAKEKYALDIKTQLGMGPLSGLRQNLAKGWQDVQTSTPYLSASATLEDISQSNAFKRTRETLSHAGQVTTAALSSVGVAITRRLGEMRLVCVISEGNRTLGNSNRTQHKTALLNLLRAFRGALPLPSPPRPSMSPSISVPTMRPSSTFKSFEDMVGNVKDKMAGGRSNGGNTSGFD